MKEQDYFEKIKKTFPKLPLRKWQEEATKYFFEHEGNAIFQSATGVGKTFFAIKLVEKIWEKEPNARVLVVVPKNVILEQGWYKEFKDAGVSIRDIGVYYSGMKEYGRKVTLTNMQNLDRIALHLFDILIADECHNYTTPRLLPLLSHSFKYRIGLSATVERLDGREENLLEIFDGNIFKYGVKEALSDGVLNPFIYKAISIEIDDITKLYYENYSQKINAYLKAFGGLKRIVASNSPVKNALLSLMNKRKDLVNNYSRKFIAVRDILKSHKNQKIIIFNQYNDTTNKLYWELLELDFRVGIIHSGIESGKRNKTLKSISNDEIDIIVTSKVLDEGYNLPRLDVAIIMASDSSDKQKIQRLGRVIRKKETDSYIYYLYCEGTIEENFSEKSKEIYEDLSKDIEKGRLALNESKISFGG